MGKDDVLIMARMQAITVAGDKPFLTDSCLHSVSDHLLSTFIETHPGTQQQDILEGH